MTAAIVIRHDARRLPLPDESVDLIITSPPYWSLRSYTDGGEHFAEQLGSEASPKEFVANLVDCTREWVRVLKPTGSIFVNLGDKYAGSGGHNNAGVAGGPSKLQGRSQRSVPVTKLRRDAPKRYNQHTGGVRPKSLMGLPWRYALEVVDTLGLILRAEIIWDKPNGIPEPVKDRVTRKHEYWFHFTRDGKAYGDTDPLRQPHSPKSFTVHTMPRKGTGIESTGEKLNEWLERNGGRQPDPKGVRPGSVWRIASEPLRAPVELGIDHFAAFPSEWPIRLILGWSQPGGVVLDPFGGTGTTALAAQELGRVGITNDLSSDYCRLAQWRTTDPKQLARIRKRIAERGGAR